MSARLHGLGLYLACLVPLAACGDNIKPDVGIEVTPMAVAVSETGTAATFTVSLLSQPDAEVMLPLAVSDATEGEIDRPVLRFTPDDFEGLRVTVTGLDDTEDDGDVTFAVVTDRASSSDGRYAGLDAADVTVTNSDDEEGGTPAIMVTANPDLQTTEAGGMAMFTVVLATQPTADVTIDVATSDDTEGTADATTITFTMDNWDTPQTVTVTGVDDAADDGDVAYTIALAPSVSADPAYNGIDPADVPVTNIDDDGVGITVSPLTGLITDESGGTAMFTVVLSAQPTADVTIAVASSDLTEGTVDTALLTFTMGNWDTPQTVTVTGVDDDLDDGDVDYTAQLAPAVSTDPAFNGIDPADPMITNLDDDTPGITVTPTTGLVTTELGGTDTFTIVLNSQPMADVTIGITSEDLTEGTAAPATVTFTTDNWDTPQPVTVTGADDAVDDGDVEYTIVTAPAVSSDTAYAGLDADNVTVTNLDNEAAGFLVIPANGLVTREDGLMDTFTIVLTSMPTANVTIGLLSSDPAEASVSPSMLTFTPGNWDTPQPVTVTGEDDPFRDGPIPFTIITQQAMSADPAYDGENPINVQGTNFDDEPASVQVIGQPPLTVSEGGLRDRFRVRLTQQPTATVVCTFTSSDTGEATLSPAVLTFTVTNWQVYQPITVFGTDDPVDDGDQPFTVVSAPCTSVDPQYNGLDPRDLDGINQDND